MWVPPHTSHGDLGGRNSAASTGPGCVTVRYVVTALDALQQTKHGKFHCLNIFPRGKKKSELRGNLQLSPKQGKTAKEGLVKTQRETDLIIRKEMLVHIRKFYL